eukprot:TRINITY_DN17659_c0_g1_i1.p1 TRINITY_DN17659_c0_g1~~TRINITY_DN17659_c0_g1_i1.p1  ORF type:complete len:264 (+),score=65.95 TRINITY_DN17659_c0_g1_i1:56-847(+)
MAVVVKEEGSGACGGSDGDLDEWEREELEAELKHVMDEFAAALESNAAELCVSGMVHITCLEYDIGRLNRLRVLDVHNNPKLRSIDSSVSLLFGLRKLRLAYCDLAEWPAALCGLSGLEELDLGNNNIEMVPVDVACMKSLLVLVLDSNMLASVPAAVTETQLRTLMIENNPLVSDADPDPARKVPIRIPTPESWLARGLENLSAMSYGVSLRPLGNATPRTHVSFCDFAGVKSLPIHFYLHPDDPCNDLFAAAGRRATLGPV